MSALSVLSFGYTRGLWDGEASEDRRRLTAYAEHLSGYFLITNSYKKHGLRELRLGARMLAIPTDAFCVFDSLARMLWIGGRILRREKIDLLQAQDATATGIVAIILGKLFRRPVNICIFGTNIYDPHWLASHWSHRWHARLGRWVLGQCRGVQVDGKMTARSLIAAGFPADRVAVKPMVPANLDSFLAIARPARPPGSPVRLLFVGRLAAQKNLPLLFTALAELRGLTPCEFALHLVGDGPEEPRLRALAEHGGWEGRVFFHGAISREHIVAAFSEAEIFVLSSDYEGYPRVLMEAAAAALPIVTTAVSGSDEAVVESETGYVVPVGDASALAGKISLLIDDADLRRCMGETAREHIRGQLDPRTNTPGQMAIWSKVAAQPRLRHLLLFNLVTDTAHPILGFTTSWIRELAARVETIDVITMQAGIVDVPANVRVHSVGKERGFSEPRRLVEFYRHLFRVLRERPIDGCFSHMIQIFAVLAAPVLRARGIPLVSWYAHPRAGGVLKLAHHLSDRMVTSLPGAYPYRHDKLTVIGQGIDTTLFAPAEPASANDDLLLCVGRLSRVKNHPALLRALALLPHHVRVEIVGATAGADDEEYAAELRQLAAELGLGARVTFAPPMPPAELPAIYRRCVAHVNLTPAGFGDKVAWEAMSCGRPCLVANADFRETLGVHAEALLFRENDAADLAARLRALLAQTAAERAAIGRDLRVQVERLHALPRLAERILETLAACRGQRA